MTKDDVLELVKDGESETLEFKSTTGGRREAAVSLCAMLNKQGGRVLFGVTPEGKATGQKIGEGTIEELKAEIDEIMPRAIPSIERVRVTDDLEVISVCVKSSTSHVHHYKGRSYCRIGNTNAIMSPTEIVELHNDRNNNLTKWNELPATGWTIEDLDEQEIQRTVSDAVSRGRLDQVLNGSAKDILIGLGLLHNGVPTRAAAVLFGRREKLSVHFSQCLIRAARFRGSEKGDFLDNRRFEGNAFTILSLAEKFLRDNNPIAGTFSPDSFIRQDQPRYPPLAVREALVNALCHRSYESGAGSIGLAIYDDRLEVISSGSLKFGLTPETLFEPHKSNSRNPLIARAFYLRGIIEVWGSGIKKMAEMSLSAGLPRPEIEDSKGEVTVRFMNEHRDIELNEANSAQERRDAVVAVLERANNGMSASEVLKRMPFGVTYRQVRRTLSELGSSKVAVASGQGPRTRWKLLSDDDKKDVE